MLSSSSQIEMTIRTFTELRWSRDHQRHFLAKKRLLVPRPCSSLQDGRKVGKRLFVCLFVWCVFRSGFVKKIQLPGYIAEPRSNKKMMGEVPRGFFLSPPPHRFLLSAWVHLLALTGTRSPAGPSIMTKNFVAKGVVSALLRLYMVSVAQKVDSAIHLCILP